MAAQNLTLSIRQHIKFFLMKHHVLDWVRGNKTNNQQDLLYDTGKVADKLFAYILNDSFAYRHIWKNGGATIQRQGIKPHVTSHDVWFHKLIAMVSDIP
jgi:hypothetical protein